MIVWFKFSTTYTNCIHVIPDGTRDEDVITNLSPEHVQAGTYDSEDDYEENYEDDSPMHDLEATTPTVQEAQAAEEAPATTPAAQEAPAQEALDTPMPDVEATAHAADEAQPGVEATVAAVQEPLAAKEAPATTPVAQEALETPMPDVEATAHVVDEVQPVVEATAAFVQEPLVAEEAQSIEGSPASTPAAQEAAAAELELWTEMLLKGCSQCETRFHLDPALKGNMYCMECGAKQSWSQLDPQHHRSLGCHPATLQEVEAKIAAAVEVQELMESEEDAPTTDTVMPDLQAFLSFPTAAAITDTATPVLQPIDAHDRSIIEARTAVRMRLGQSPLPEDVAALHETLPAAIGEP
jgi:hypothetical protein